MITREKIKIAKNTELIDVLDKLNIEYKHFVGDTYYLKEHDSLKITLGKGWYWFSQGIGGNTIDFFMNVYGKSFKESLELILNEEMRGVGNNKISNKENKINKEKLQNKKKEFRLPSKNNNYKRLYAYLINTRKIEKSIVDLFVKNKLIYESSKTHNIVFVGQKEDDKVKYALQRGTNSEKSFINEIYGSVKAFSFLYKTQNFKNAVRIFESPIDLLSYMSICKMKSDTHNFNNCDYLALGGTSLESIKKYLDDNKEVKTVIFSTDNDDKGKKAYLKAKDLFIEHNVVSDFPKMKDYNDDLKELRKMNINKEKIYALCNLQGYFTCGDNNQYSKMFEMLENGASIHDIALVIWICSDNKDLDDIEKNLQKELEDTYDLDMNKFNYRDVISKMSNINHREYVKSIISNEFSLNDEEKLEAVYDLYMDSDNIKLLNDEIYNYIDREKAVSKNNMPDIEIQIEEETGKTKEREI